MKTLKITFLLLAVLFLTVSGQSSDNVIETVDIKKMEKNHTTYDLLATTKKKLTKPNNG